MGAEEKLAESEDRYRDLVEHSQELICTHDLEGRILSVNPWASRTLGRKLEDLSRMNVRDVLAPEVRQEFETYLAGIRRDGVARGLMLVETATGEKRIWEYHNTLRTEGVPAPIVRGMAYDVTDRKRAEKELKSSRERLLALSRRLIEAQEVERRRIARELHDEIGQELTALKINLQAAQRPGDDEATSRLADSLEIVERTTKQVRDLSLALRPSLLDDLGLVAALRWHADGEAKRAGFTLDFVAEPADIRPAPEIGIACYRVVQEALTNVARHARAGHVRVELAAAEGWLDLRIHDDGVGFDARAARERAARGASFGLLSMTERARLLDGRLEIDSAPGRGTEIRARFPLEAKER